MLSKLTGLREPAVLVPGSREFLETMLAEHLAVAARARRRMDTADACDDQYIHDVSVRDAALKRARLHYFALIDLGVSRDDLTARFGAEPAP
jgi:hypothetical protein